MNTINKSIILVLGILLCAIILPATASATIVNTNCVASTRIPLPGGGNNGTVTLPQASNLSVRLDAACGVNSDGFGVIKNGVDTLIGTTHVTPIGTVINLGQFPAGPVVFTLHGEGYFQTGSINANVTALGNNQWQIGWTDQPPAYATYDYNDVVFTLTATPVQTCTPNATKKCVGNDVYNFDSCNVQGTLFKACSANQTCNNAQCVDNCTPNVTKKCVNGDVYNFDSCNTQGTLFKDCTANQTCSNGQCIDQAITCSTNAQCGSATPTGSLFCQENGVYRNYLTPTCNNPGTTSSYCSDRIVPQLQNTCTSGQTCSNGSCTSPTIRCSSASECGSSTPTGSLFCQGNNIYRNYTTWTCNNAGTANSYCSSAPVPQLQSSCNSNQTCSNGSCSAVNTCSDHSYQRCSGSNLYWYDSCGNQQGVSQYCSNGCNSGSNSCNNYNYNTCTYHSYQRCYNNALYWYDSCGTMQDVAQYCANGCYNGACQTYNYNYSSTTVQSNPATNVVNNQATLNGYLNTYSNNYNSYNTSCPTNVWFQWGPSASYGYETPRLQQNYSGAFSQNISNIYAGTVYHFRAAAQDCNGNTVYGQDSLVYPTQVLGASTVSTGLTNNFWMDSFILPLMLALLGIGLIRSGMFFGVEKWFDSKKKNRRSFMAEKELNQRILSIKQQEQK